MYIGLAFLLTIMAGLSTGIGSLIAFVAKRNNTKLLTFAMGFAGGVMLYVSFTEILPEAIEGLEAAYGDHSTGAWLGTLSFFIGMFIVAMIDKLIPSAENSHEFVSDEHKDDMSEARKRRLMRVGMMTALALAIHNFPEGFATFVAALKDPELGVTIAFAIALHNIPEGIAVSMPIYYATGSKSKAFWYSFLSGIVEPLGAIVGYFLLSSFLDDMVISYLLGSVAGMMVFIALDQLLPAAEEYGHHHLSIYGVVSGMAMMAVSLLLLVGHAH